MLERLFCWFFLFLYYHLIICFFRMFSGSPSSEALMETEFLHLIIHASMRPPVCYLTDRTGRVAECRKPDSFPVDEYGITVLIYYPSLLQSLPSAPPYPFTRHACFDGRETHVYIVGDSQKEALPNWSAGLIYLEPSLTWRKKMPSVPPNLISRGSPRFYCLILWLSFFRFRKREKDRVCCRRAKPMMAR
ncbi:uncharacterized protein EI90DRAFT_1002319 [Cantharellus anzutake]|uniref:uncharacterized protein n=1 Tax=Cantharellus anzutake TaxID=1750568 RepID=UPI0019038EAE|nr:uncharacterized protein EI90DRAFT_1002319 [Cantharellus anzutake]KAF8331285.1 hypothetical protein EI90DRAFT_1002319 [Cantharellus anzutake]